MKQFENDGGAHETDNVPEIEVTEIRSDAPETPETPPENKKKKPRRWMYIVGAVVLALIIGLIAYAIWERPPEVAAPAPKTEQTDAPAAPGADKPGKTETPLEEEPDPGEAPAVEFTSERKPGVYTMLIVGRDFASNSTDTILVGSFDTVQHEITCVSLPRDTLINISWSTTPKKINAVFPGYINSGENGIDGLKKQVRNLLGFDVDCYAVVTLEAVEQAVDAIGGVWFDVPQDMYYYDFSQDLVIEIKEGYQLLDGENTLKLCRFRDGYAGGDIERIGVQQNLLKALAKQMLTLGNIPNLSELIDILVANVDTDLSAANIAWFARQFLQCGMDDISFQTAPFNAGCFLNGVSFVSLDTTKWLQLINESMNPFKDDVTLSNVNILTCNGSGTYVSATNGVVAGGPDSFYCLTCTVKNGGKAVHHAPGACPKDEPEEAEPPAEEPAETPEDPGETPTPGEEVPTEPETPAEGGEIPAETPQIEVVTVPADPEPADVPAA